MAGEFTSLAPGVSQILCKLLFATMHYPKWQHMPSHDCKQPLGPIQRWHCLRFTRKRRETYMGEPSMPWYDIDLVKCICLRQRLCIPTIMSTSINLKFTGRFRSQDSDDVCEESLSKCSIFVCRPLFLKFAPTWSLSAIPKIP